MNNEMKSETGSEPKKVTNKTAPGIETKTTPEKAGDIIIEGVDIVRTFKMGEVLVRALRGVNVKHSARRVCCNYGRQRLRKNNSLEPAGPSRYPQLRKSHHR